MDDWKKYLILLGGLVLLALCTPVLIALLGIVLSPVIGIAGFVCILFIITVIIAFKNKNERK
ncbi:MULTISPECIES: hypothetical protein [Eubacterium]|uniref:hypothetical protein n=1 Tax=Eubacterium TaxID=1730 RepID=UPI000B7DFEEE|nr:hypothetical protein [Eubacterium barkeri]